MTDLIQASSVSFSERVGDPQLAALVLTEVEKVFE